MATQIAPSKATRGAPIRATRGRHFFDIHYNSYQHIIDELAALQTALDDLPGSHVDRREISDEIHMLESEIRIGGAV